MGARSEGVVAEGVSVSGALKLVTGTTGSPVSLPEIRTWLRLEEGENAEDDLLESLISRATARIEERTQRAFLIKTYDYWLDYAPDGSCPLDIPKAPLVSVTSIKAYQSTEATDTGGTAMTTSDYYVDTQREFGRVLPVSGATFPTATRTINAFVVRFTAGYSTAAANVPASAKTEIKELVARMYDHRGDEVELDKVLAEYGTAPTDLDLPDWG